MHFADSQPNRLCRSM